MIKIWKKEDNDSEEAWKDTDRTKRFKEIPKSVISELEINIVMLCS